MDIQEEMVRQEVTEGLIELVEKVHGRSVVWDRMISREKIKQIVAEIAGSEYE